MRKQILVTILLVSVAFFSFNSKTELSNRVQENKNSLLPCGPAFDSLYNQHSTCLVDNVNVIDPLSNHFSLGFGAEPGDVFSISNVGSQCGYAGGTYHFFIHYYNPAAGSIIILDQSNNVILCKNTDGSHSSYHLVLNAQCATTYKIVISNFSC